MPVLIFLKKMGLTWDLLGTYLGLTWDSFGTHLGLTWELMASNQNITERHGNRTVDIACSVEDK